MKKNIVNLIVRIFGIILILLGLTLAIIPMFNFNVYTFKLLPVIIFALGFPFCGLVLIVLSYIINSNNSDNIDTTSTTQKRTRKSDKNIDKK